MRLSARSRQALAATASVLFIIAHSIGKDHLFSCVEKN